MTDRHVLEIDHLHPFRNLVRCAFDSGPLGIVVFYEIFHLLLGICFWGEGR
jgi:hypothetical protein